MMSLISPKSELNADARWPDDRHSTGTASAATTIVMKGTAQRTLAGAVLNGWSALMSCCGAGNLDNWKARLPQLSPSLLQHRQDRGQLFHRFDCLRRRTRVSGLQQVHHEKQFLLQSDHRLL
jgi:hypothetical protein